jgi:hypothetical protein
MRFPLTLLVASTLAMGSIGIATAAPIEGCYVQTHDISVRGDTPTAPDELASVVDHFGIRGDSDSTYEFDLLVVGDYGHVCQATGRLETTRKEKREVLTLLQDEDAEAMRERGAPLCKLTVEGKARTIDIHANEACNDQFACGVRAGIHDRSFRRSGTAPKKSKPPCFQSS